ncbi:bifunctional metallophosphatase/5'-nucleotidase [Metabacillus indicus]|uniref:bifunctional metallophosphatase/5'-nucleotidase n=1 Tax=Metabacillus indicus TaxID=246786 RepID=UPI0009D6CB87|nr:bifunctional metallophosphatase/5'-nucleotidase [Metabacillus indicus]
MKHSVKTAGILFMIVLFLFFASVFGESQGRAGTDDSKLTEIHLLGINDFHGQLDTHSVQSGKKVGGAEYLAAHINKRRELHEHSLLLHAGDMTGGSPPLSSLFLDEPAVEFMNQLKFDAGTPGNHEFDRGIGELKRLINGGYHRSTGYFKGADFDYVSANVIDKQTGKPIFPAYTIKKIDGVQLGIIGVVTKETNQFLLPENREQIEITDESEAINQAASQLKKLGVESIIVLAHAAVSSDENGEHAGEELIEMAPKITDEVDVIFGAHSHKRANTRVGNKMIVQSYSYGKAFSDVTLLIDRDQKEIIQKEAQIILTDHSQAPPDEGSLKLIEKYKKRVGAEYSKEIGSLPHDLSRKKNDQGHSPLAALLAESMMKEMNTDIAFVHHGGIRESLKRGPVTKQHVIAALPFNHYAAEISLSGKQIREILEQQWSLKAENLLQTQGLTFEIDRSAPKGERIKALKTEDGEVIEDQKMYRAAASNYLASGGDGFEAFKSGEIIQKGPELSDVLSAYFVEKFHQ